MVLLFYFNEDGVFNAYLGQAYIDPLHERATDGLLLYDKPLAEESSQVFQYSLTTGASRVLLGISDALCKLEPFPMPGRYRHREVVPDLKLIGSPGVFGNSIPPTVVDPLLLGIDHHIRKDAA